MSDDSHHAVEVLTASAPGKLVVSGEYAVLDGATALVQAFDRRVHCRIEPGGQDWQLQSSGFEGTVRHRLDALFSVPPATQPPPPAPSDPARLTYWILRSMAARGLTREALPRHLRIELDSRSCFEQGTKLGLGSSAAVAAVLGVALAELCHWREPLAMILEAHHAAQGGRGSGLDVAAAWHGGTIAFRRPASAGELPVIEPVTLPPQLGTRCVFSGRSTATGGQIERFERWRATGRPAALTALCEAADGLAAAPPAADRFMAQLAHYVRCLAELDRAASLGVFSEAQHRLTRLARRADVIYKPCGAGGGDTGMAFSLDAQALTRFEELARAAGFLLPAMEPDRNGIEISRVSRR